MKTSLRGFKNVAADIARRDGYSVKRASAVLASRTRKASKAARMRNPALNRVRGH